MVFSPLGVLVSFFSKKMQNIDASTQFLGP